MRLTPEIIRNAPIYLNPIGQREISLRGLRCPLVENLGITEDLNESMDLAQNELTKLDNFPQLTQLRTLIASNNRIYKLDANLGSSLPNLESLVLTNNRIRKFSDLIPLVKFTKLTCLYLVGNPIHPKLLPSSTPHASLNPYRVAIAVLCPELTVLDFSKVTVEERKEANKLRKRYSSSANDKKDAGDDHEYNEMLVSYLEQLDEDVQEENDADQMKAVEGKDGSQRDSKHQKLTEEQQKTLRARIEASNSLEELEILANILNTGNIPHGFSI